MFPQILNINVSEGKDVLEILKVKRATGPGGINISCQLLGTLANNVDSDQTPQNAASDQVQHCLLKFVCVCAYVCVCVCVYFFTKMK